MKTMRERPLQVYLRPDQDKALRHLAETENVSIAELVRRGVDRLLAETPPEQDPLIALIGIGQSGFHDISENHDLYLAQLYQKENDSFVSPRKLKSPKRNRSSSRKRTRTV